MFSMTIRRDSDCELMKGAQWDGNRVTRYALATASKNGSKRDICLSESNTAISCTVQSHRPQVHLSVDADLVPITSHPPGFPWVVISVGQEIRSYSASLQRKFFHRYFLPFGGAWGLLKGKEWIPVRQMKAKSTFRSFLLFTDRLGPLVAVNLNFRFDAFYFGQTPVLLTWLDNSDHDCNGRRTKATELTR